MERVARCLDFRTFRRQRSVDSHDIWTNTGRRRQLRDSRDHWVFSEAARMSELHSLPAHLWQDEVWLSFHQDREEDRDRHPLKGLRRFGPFSGSLISSMMDPIRVAAVVPQGCRSWFTGILAELNQSHQPSERAAYLV